MKYDTSGRPLPSPAFEAARETLYECASNARTDDPRALPLAIARYLKLRPARTPSPNPATPTIARLISDPD